MAGRYRRRLLLPLMLKRSAVEDNVVADLKKQLCAIVEILDRMPAGHGL